MAPKLQEYLVIAFPAVILSNITATLELLIWYRLKLVNSTVHQSPSNRLLSFLTQAVTAGSSELGF